MSRIAGDALYGGVLGLASAGLSAAGAIGDEIFAANNDGKSASGTLVAALFGNETDNNVQVAENPAPAATAETTAAIAETAQAQETVVAQAENIPTETTQDAAPAAPAPAGEKLMTLASAATAPAAGMTLAPSKLPYGGVIDLSAMTGAAQNQNMPVAADGRRELLQAQRTMRNSRFAVALPSKAQAMPAIEAKPTPETQTAMQKLLDELQAMKAINQYQNAAQNMPLAGENVNILN